MAPPDMCGINGIFAYCASAGTPDRAELIATRDAMIRRGPDGAGEYWSDDARLGLGHRRLSIIDLSDRASQPMASDCGRYVVTFNGEIYNYPELKRELEAKGRQFRTTSDTEVLLHLYASDGERMVGRLRGMFAFAIWDKAARTLFLARDPYGIKPLYTANDGWTFRFASQVKALLAGGAISREPEPAGVVGFHLWGSVPEPFTIYRDIRALPAGHTQIVDAAGPREPKPYASIGAILVEGCRAADPGTDASDRIRDAVRSSVRSHLIADVEVGLFLSAGVDSGAILGLLHDSGRTDVRAITLAFDEFRGTPDDETPLAAEVARQYGARQVVRTVRQAEFDSDLSAILDAMDQPTIDGVNSWFIAKAAREIGLKVAISGVGGDELFAGYPSFRDIPRWVSWLRLPGAVLGAGRAARALLGATGIDRRSPKAAGLVEYGGSFAGAYLLRRALFLPFELGTVLDQGLVRQGLARLKPLDRVRAAMASSPANAVARVASLESTLYLRNQLLRDADWAGMAHSLEIRTPLVDIVLLRELAGVVATLRPGAGKLALAEAPAKPLPRDVWQRAKSGFGVPTGRWIQAATSRTSRSKGAASRAWSLEVLKRSSGADAQPVAVPTSAPELAACAE